MRFTFCQPIVAAIGLALACQTLAVASPSGEELVHVELISDGSGIEPGVAFTVGIGFRIEPGWHIYWINPGDAGEPTKAKLELPAGLTLVDLNFPAPKRFMQAGDIVGYGYETEVMLLATVLPSKDLKVGESLTIGVKSSWLVCAEVCIPGEASAHISLPVATKSTVIHEAIFEKWRSRLPMTVDDKIRSLSAMITSDRIKIVLDLKPPAPKSVEWFPPAGDDLSVSDLKVHRNGTSTEIDAKLEAMPTRKIPDSLFPSVIVYRLEDGTTRAIELDLRLDRANDVQYPFAKPAIVETSKN